MATGHGCIIHMVSGDGTAIGVGTVIGDFTQAGVIHTTGEAGMIPISDIPIGTTTIMAHIMTIMPTIMKVNADV